ncbi:MAG: replication-relaxation family protein [Pseudomonadota bacterium]
MPKDKLNHTDALGRNTFQHIGKLDGVKPTPRERRWLKHIERHGPQSSIYLHALTSDTHSCKDTSLRQLQKLRAAGFLRLPPQQRATEHANFNSYIYDLTKRAEDHLFETGVGEPSVRPHGHWVHQYMTACVTSSIDILAAQSGVRYIPTHEILAIKNSSFAVPINGQKLVPDQLFALDYGGSYRAFVLEVDRGTEPKTTTQLRKSYMNSILLYRRLIEQNIYRSHYGLTANLIVLWTFSSRRNQMKFLKMVGQTSGGLQRSVFTQTVSGFDHNWRPPNMLTELFQNLWTGVDGAQFSAKYP